MTSPAGADDLGGDGSDDDLYEIAGAAASEAEDAIYGFCSNDGMLALADMISDAIEDQAAGMAEENEPDISALYDAIADVHSADTAQSCMDEAIQTAYEILMDAFDEIIAHEVDEGD